MTEYVLTAIDTTQIQGYVFGSNRLKENLGGSELVEMATHRWVYEALPPSNNIADIAEGTIGKRRTIAETDAEVIYAGGGNTLILFKSKDVACTFTKTLTKRVLLDAPGLEIVVAHQKFVWEEEPSLAQVAQDLLAGDLTRKKQKRVPSLPLLGLGVTVPCSSTGLVAADCEEDRLISREIKAKIFDGIQNSAESRIKTKLARIAQSGWRIPKDFDDLGRSKGDEGYIAIVHADGNGMGKRVEQIAQQYNTSGQNREYINAMRKFSQGLEGAATRAMQRVVELMADALIVDNDLAERHQRNFPLRPIVFGGDDVTFVCHGKYGLPLAIRYLRVFEEETMREPAFEGQGAFACAGVAIVKTHYPFARAYRLSEQLCQSAKRFVRDQGQDCSGLDWQIAMSGITGTVKDIRDREYSVDAGILHLRPILMQESSHTWRAWPTFEKLLQEFIREDGTWYERRNKVKALREALRSGPNAVCEFLSTYRLKHLPRAHAINVPTYDETGWAQDRCVHFDPIEMMDFYEDLEGLIMAKQESELQYASI
jgi:hypothetical protein